MSTWESDEGYPVQPELGAMGILRAVARGFPLAILVFGCLGLLLLLRLIERPLFGLQRPWTPHITQFVCRNAFRLLGIRFTVTGTPIKGRGAVVANHSSWLDIFALNAPQQVYFVSKAEVAKWPGIGWLARATGTLFIRRDRREARAHKQMFEDRLLAGHQLLFFPEGTSSDSQRVLPFKTTLFEAFFDPRLREEMVIQPVTVHYTAPKGAEPRFYGWWGDMDFGPHLLCTLAAPRQGQVDVIYHPPLNVSDFANRKSLARAAETQIRSGLKK
ncbi:lysophospholipid acyltransferase family protein [Shimia sp. MMG029]|uniref:lysophospholipid acyltransferase family protein n=1 Tax=Shimia sp. MMG029 TaxID=3021978 RepID=UPI0022FDF700|nr:lysophospholipid acyltransferase family protein [Shimia sp. MMG029]MDA5555832.1 lysophospholipid acyltransferase family protein [Shimia sp. MMG029]